MPTVRDKRLRPFRALAYGVYFAFVLVFVALLSTSVIRSVARMSPRSPADTDTTLSISECLDRLEGLWRRLDQERHTLSRSIPAHEADQAWTRFRVSWVSDLRTAESLCAIHSRDRAALKRAFRRLDQVNDLYTTHAVQYAGEVGPAVDSLRTAMEVARRRQRPGKVTE